MLEAQLRKIVHRHWGAGTRFSCEELNSRGQGVAVQRLHLQKSGKSFSVILKAIRPNGLTDSETFNIQRFREERFNYLFLSQIYPNFKRFPKLLDQREDYMILEDLGKHRYRYASQQIFMESIAESLVELHCATAEKLELYQDCRQRYQIGDNPQRKYSMQQYNRFFHKGKEQVKIFARQLNLDLRDFDLTPDLIYQRINDAGGFLAFIHGDLASLRQTVCFRGQTFFVDFEGGKYTHSLLDLAEILIGKFEYMVNAGYHFLNHMELPISIVDVYRQKLQHQQQRFIDDKTWDREVGHALIYNVLRNVGVLGNVDSPSVLVGGFNGCLQSLFHRGALLLSDNDEHKNTQRLFQKLACQTYSRPTPQ